MFLGNPTDWQIEPPRILPTSHGVATSEGRWWHSLRGRPNAFPIVWSDGQWRSCSRLPPSVPKIPNLWQLPIQALTLFECFQESPSLSLR